jgi:hypothetical protein
MRDKLLPYLAYYSSESNHDVLSSVVDPDPGGSEILAGSGSGKIIPDPDPSSSGSEQLRIQNEFEVKLL